MAKSVSITCDICSEPVGRMTKPVEKPYKDVYKRVFGKDLEDACASCQNPLAKLHDAYKQLAAGGKREAKPKEKAPAGEPPTTKTSAPKVAPPATTPGATVTSAKQLPAEKGEKTPF